MERLTRGYAAGAILRALRGGAHPIFTKWNGPSTFTPCPRGTKGPTLPAGNTTVKGDRVAY
jgi:hypothetical protein